MPGYFAKRSEGIVHHLATIKDDCKLHPIEKRDKVYFTPDSLENAISQKFIPCKYCIDNKLKQACC